MVVKLLDSIAVTFGTGFVKVTAPTRQNQTHRHHGNGSDTAKDNRSDRQSNRGFVTLPEIRYLDVFFFK